MKKLIILFITMTTAMGAGWAQNEPGIIQPYIEVNGYNKTEVTPDRIFISFQINEKDSKGRTSIDSQEKTMIRALQNAGIDVSTQLTINDLASNFQKYVLRKTDIQLSRNYMLEVGSAAQAIAAFSALESANVANATVDRAEYREIEQLKLDVKVRATQNARDKAKTLAESIGQTVGKAIYIQDLERSYRPYTSNVLMRSVAADMVETGGGASAPALEFEKITVDANITVRFMLE